MKFFLLTKSKKSAPISLAMKTDSRLDPLWLLIYGIGLIMPKRNTPQR